MSNIKIFNHEQFGKLDTIISDDSTIYFDGNQVAQMLGYVNPRDAIKRHCKGVAKHSTFKNRGGYPLTVIPIEDVVALVNKSEILVADEKEKILSGLKLDNYVVINSRKEIEFKEELENFIGELGYEIKHQYKVLNYYIDFYIPALNLAIEYDENHHKDQNEADKQREEEIQKEIGCKFIRVDDGLSIGKQLGIVTKKIMGDI